MPMTAREAALKTLAARRKNGAWSEAVLHSYFAKENFDRRDASLASKLCYGVLQNQMLLDFYISSVSTTAPEKLEPLVLDILRLTFYQLVFLSKIPHSAAVNEAVILTKKYANPRAAAFVNAVSRKISSLSDRLPHVPHDTIETALSVRYSHPKWLVEEYCKRLGAIDAELLLQADNAEAPVTAQLNLLKADEQTILKALSADEVDISPHPWLSGAVFLKSTGSLERLSAFKNGYIFIQDAAARLAVLAADPKPGTITLDVCAAPGGKSFASALHMQNRGRIVASDIHEKKLGLIRESALRLGISVIETRAGDARIVNPELLQFADTVIADVPCSGLGVIRKKPDIRYKNREDLQGLPEVQRDILNTVSQYVKPGGVLLYSTCTLLRRENEEIVEAFLSSHADFSLEFFECPQPIGASDGMLTLWPHIFYTDGFFIAKLRRVQ